MPELSLAVIVPPAVHLKKTTALSKAPLFATDMGYLAMLAARLNLDPGLVEHLHANADRLLTSN